ncbi:hypothetical protein GALL_495130 [mine drainage metagenome]|uniref:Uncharacterized protein n=1 Tax=mine drainage metagenome TaxID=410659 RepID=A0A1J5PB63_9ZZZZ
MVATHDRVLRLPVPARIGRDFDAAVGFDQAEQVAYAPVRGKRRRAAGARGLAFDRERDVPDTCAVQQFARLDGAGRARLASRLDVPDALQAQHTVSPVLARREAPAVAMRLEPEPGHAAQRLEARKPWRLAGLHAPEEVRERLVQALERDLLAGAVHAGPVGRQIGADLREAPALLHVAHDQARLAVGVDAFVQGRVPQVLVRAQQMLHTSSLRGIRVELIGDLAALHAGQQYAATHSSQQARAARAIPLRPEGRSPSRGRVDILPGLRAWICRATNIGLPRNMLATI